MYQYLTYKDPIECIEKTLREVVNFVLTKEYNHNWLLDNCSNYGIDSESIKSKQRVEQGTQKPLPIYDLPISYIEFKELINILKTEKKIFKPIFADWDKFNVFLQVVDDLRNTVKHHRDLKPTQYELLSGIAGEVEDSVNLWRIGNKLEMKKIRFDFAEIISRENKSDSEILNEAQLSISSWVQNIEKATFGVGFHTPRNQISKDDYSYELIGQHFKVKVYTKDNAETDSSPNHKRIYGKLEWNSSILHKLSEFIKLMDKPYYAIIYQLAGEINVESLHDWAKNLSGLFVTSGGSMNNHLTSIEYRLPSVPLTLQAQSNGELSANTGNYDVNFWRFHEFIKPQHLIGFMVGSIIPRSMMHLINLSKIDYKTVDLNDN